MKKTHDTTIIIAILILVLFALFTILYMFLGNNMEYTSESQNIVSNIYSENIHNHMTSNKQITSNITIQKTYETIGSYTTKIYDTDKNRVYNIERAANKLDGHVIKVNEEFSFNDTMGTMGKADGYKKSIGFDSNGNKIKMYGGGICQISSTLYNAVLAAKLKVTERHAHSRRVYYVPKNKDATVFSGGPDFKFVNSSNSTIMICVSTDGYTVTVSLKEEKITKI